MKRYGILVLLLIIILLSPTAVQAKCKGKADLKKADRFYFDKNFDEALKGYLAAHEKGCQDGITTYKIAFCHMKAGNREKENEFFNKALSALQDESTKKPTLENLFYLANCYINLEQKDKAIETSKLTITRYEEGGLGKIKDATSIFRIGKIYLDAQQFEKGIEHYRKAYELSKKEKDFPVEYRKMILQRLAEYDYRAKYYAGALEEFEVLASIDPKSNDAYFYLAIVAMNLGQFEKAEDAWKKVISLGLQYSDEAQYNHRIARAAIDESPLPAEDTSGRLYREMRNDELEEKIIEISQRGQDIKKMAIENKGDVKQLEDDLKQTKKFFIAACAELISRGVFLRDTAIMKGFAVQIMRKDPWEIPQEENP